ncbi:MAG: sigma-54 dependent transcriptional regulator [Spirochaetia bacterium]
MPFTILIVDDEREMCASLAEIFESHGLDSLFTADPLAVPALIEKNRIGLILMDIKMPQLRGIDLLKLVKGRDRSIPVIMITGYPSIENAVESMRYGALNFFVKPLKIKELITEIERIRASQSEAGTESERAHIVTADPRMQGVLQEIDRVAPTDAPVLITGESGTGKELAAAAIHERSARREGAFVKVNCASIPDTLLESEMFGHEMGAFTDAIRRRVGKLEIADNGTIFFDEIGDMTAGTQPKLLRVLQDGEFQRLGGTQTLHTNTRVIAATNKDIGELLTKKLFREDLYYRLSVVTIHLPALRERKEDIEILIRHFIELFNAKYGKEICRVSEPVKDILYRHNWPGNVRELKNCLERAAIFCDSAEIGEDHLPAQYLKIRDQGFPDSLEAIYDKMSREKISEALTRSHGEKQKAAKLLNISRKTLYNRMKKLGLE